VAYSSSRHAQRAHHSDDMGQLTYGAPYSREKFWAHRVYLFSIAREASTVVAVPPELPDEALPKKCKPE
jgi:hypothetical protein